MIESVDWKSLEVLLAAACDEPDEETAERAVRAAELVASTAGEPPDELSPQDREWAESTASHRPSSSISPAAR